MELDFLPIGKFPHCVKIVFWTVYVSWQALNCQNLHEASMSQPIETNRVYGLSVGPILVENDRYEIFRVCKGHF